jgi:hypothetical protein
MEELGLPEEMAQSIVDRCAEEAKLVQVEQEAKKAAEAAQKQADRAAFAAASGGLVPAGVGARGVDAEAFANPLLPRGAAAVVKEEELILSDESDDKLPGAMEATEGASPEIVTHSEGGADESNELAPEEAAVHLPGAAASDEAEEDQNRRDDEDDEADTTALAEGRAEPPAGLRDEPV